MCVVLKFKVNNGLVKSMSLCMFERSSCDRVGNLVVVLCVLGLFGTLFNSPKLRLHDLRGM